MMLMVADELQVYRQNQLTFILLPEKILIKTSLQMFTLEPKTHYYNRRIALIRAMISLGEIRSLEELSSFCASGQIAWINTSAKYYLDQVKL